MTPTIEEKVFAIIAQQAAVDVGDISSDRLLASLALDSLGLVEAIFTIEETFDISVPFNANSPQGTSFDMSSAGAVAAAVTALIAQKAKCTA